VKYRILFVCMGNICRSPLAEGVAQAQFDDLAEQVTFDSAGTGGWHVGNPPDARAIVAARGRGIEIADQCARRISATDFDRFDLLIAMDRSTLTELEALRPPGLDTPARLFSNFHPGSPIDVPDPYYTGKFEPILDRIEAAMPGLRAALQDEGLQ